MFSVESESKSSQCGNLPDYPKSIYGSVSAVVSERLTVCGGNFRGQILDQCYSLNAESDQWEAFPSMDEARSHASAVSLPDGGLWVTGGVSEDGEPTASTSKYSPAKGHWLPGKDLPGRFRDHCLVRVNDHKVILLASEDGVAMKVYKFDLRVQIWATTDQEFPYFDRMACAHHDGAVHVLGGRDGGGAPVRSVRLYHPDTDSWSAGTDLPKALSSPRTISHNGFLVLLGGYGVDGGMNRDIYVMDAIGDKWTRLGVSLGQPEAELVALSLNNEVLDNRPCVNQNSVASSSSPSCHLSNKNQNYHLLFAMALAILSTIFAQ